MIHLFLKCFGNYFMKDLSNDVQDVQDVLYERFMLLR